MSSNMYFYIILAIIIAAVFAAFQYLYKNKKDKSITKIVLFFLRFLSIFLLFLLWINPKIKKEKLETVKTSLVVLSDNSKSIKSLKQEKNLEALLKKIKQNKKLAAKFDIDYYSFAEDILLKDTLNFTNNSTNIASSLRSVTKIYKKNKAPIILLTDGNQTVGSNYSSLKINQAVYPVILGDTTIYQDIYISQLNVNKYAYLKNKFPVELFVNYIGNQSITSRLSVMDGKTKVFSKNITLNPKENAKKIDFFIPANTVGYHNYKVNLSPLKREKNKINNRRNFSVEVINEQSKIVIVSDILHPDIAMFKRSIESNKQRKVRIVKPNKLNSFVEDQLVILYQPTNTFKNVFEELDKLNKKFLIVTGSHTNWHFLNSSQTYFSKKAINTTEDYLANFNAGYSTFLIKDLGFDNFQPVTDYFGKVTFNVPYQSILFQQIGSVSSETPLLATFEQNGKKGAVLLGENSWRWRMASKIEENSFQAYDEFMNKLIQYLSSNKKASFSEVSNKPYYYENETVNITAQYYDANYVFDPNAKLWINLTNKQTKKNIKFPFALNKSNYEVNISDLPKGNYSYKVANALNKTASYGNFTILDYNIEQQFISANKKDLEQLALNTNGKITYPNNINSLIDDLVQSNDYIAVQKSKTIITPLIDWKWILASLILLLSIEWFIRKYKGYI